MLIRASEREAGDGRFRSTIFGVDLSQSYASSVIPIKNRTTDRHWVVDCLLCRLGGIKTPPMHETKVCEEVLDNLWAIN